MLTREAELLRGARPLEYPGGVMPLDICGFRILIEKDYHKNVDRRRDNITKCQTDLALREQAIWLCSQRCAHSLIYWVNMWAYTYLLQEVLPDGSERNVPNGTNDRPFITYPYQDEILTDLYTCISAGKDMAVLKTRKMGLSWLILATFHWFWCFIPGSHFLEISRKEDLVDKPDDPDSLFWKHDYLLRHTPDWLRPRYKRSALKLVNLWNKSTIIGDSTTGDVGHGGRKTAALFDEIGRMKPAKEAWEGASQLTACRIANSTPHGPGFFMDIVQSGKCKVLRAPFYDHPHFGRGRYVKYEDEKLKISSPWRDAAVAKAVSRREIAENIDMDFMGAGFVFFDLDVLERHSAQNCEEPIYTGMIYTHDDRDKAITLKKRDVVRWFNADAPIRPWSLWIDLEPDERGVYRPPQHYTYVFGIDIAYGVAASNSVCCVKCLELNEQVGEFASATVAPHDFAEMMIEAGYWWGGSHGCAFMCWENNGGGGQNFTNKIRSNFYPWVYTMRDRRGRGIKKTDILGWNSNDVRKQEVLGVLRGAFARDEFVPRSRAMVHEARTYVWYELSQGGNSVGPASLEQESAAAEKTHGDRVIGAALAEYGSMYCHRCTPPDRVPPPSSLEARLRAWRKSKGKRVGVY